MNTLVMLLMTTCVSGADPTPVTTVAPMPVMTATPTTRTMPVPMTSYESMPTEQPQRTGFFSRLRNLFSRHSDSTPMTTYPSGTVVPGVVNEPPMASGTVSPVITSNPTTSVPATTPAATGAGIKAAQRMPGGPSN
jgi:hypothetical protein